MSKRSVYNSTYGILSEIDRTQLFRDEMMSRAQAKYDDMETNTGELGEDAIFAKASKLAMEQAEYDARIHGYTNIDEYAASTEHYNLKKIDSPDGRSYSPGEQLVEDLTEDFMDLIRKGEV